jgi:type I restriction enzyme S subunit
MEEIVLPDAPVMYGILQPGPDTQEGIPYIRPTEISYDVIQVDDLRRTSPAIANRYKRSTLQANDVILSIVGTIGKVALVPPVLSGANITQSSARLRVDHAVVRPKYLAWVLRSPILRQQFDKVRLGTAVPRLNIAHVRDLRVPIAPIAEQDRIADKLDELMSDLDAGVAALQRAKANLKRYRAAVLKAAVEGKLTEEWRTEHPDDEPASKLLERILAKRRQKWEADQLAKFAAAGKQPPKNWKAKYVEPTPPDTDRLRELPEGWSCASAAQLCIERTCNGISVKGSDSPPGIPA